MAYHALGQTAESDAALNELINKYGETLAYEIAYVLAYRGEADRAFNALAAGGQVTMPLNKTFWSARFGMLTDKFGVGWMINVVP